MGTEPTCDNKVGMRPPQPEPTDSFAPGKSRGVPIDGSGTFLSFSETRSSASTVSRHSSCRILNSSRAEVCDSDPLMADLQRCSLMRSSEICHEM